MKLREREREREEERWIFLLYVNHNRSTRDEYLLSFRLLSFSDFKSARKFLKSVSTVIRFTRRRDN